MTGRAASQSVPVVVVGGSAGALPSLIDIVASLPDDLPAAVALVLHLMRGSQSRLAEILARSTELAVSTAADGQTIEAGAVTVAPPDRHLIVKRGSYRLVAGPTENGHRPAIDPLFRSAARVYGAGVAGVLLSGAGSDGAAGLRVVADRGGLCIVQDPEEALHPQMPTAALDRLEVDHVTPAAGIAALIRSWAGAVAIEPSLGSGDMADADRTEVAAGAVLPIDGNSRPTGITCPDCGGALWEIEDDSHTELRCRVGHAYSLEGLVSEHDGKVERALWGAIVSLEEKADLLRRLAARLGDRAEGSRRRLHDRADASEDQAVTLRHLLMESLERDAG